MRIIPKTAKIKVQFFKNISVVDIIIGLSFLGLIVLLFVTNLGLARFVLMGVVLMIAIGLFLPFEGQRFYMFIVYSIKYIFSVKKYTKNNSKAQTNIENFLPFKNIKDNYIEYSDYYGGVLEISPREFHLLSEFRQNQMIDENFGRIIREISDKTRASIVKIDRKLSFASYIKEEETKKNELRELFENKELSKEEYDSRIKVIEDRIRAYSELTNDTPIRKPFYYLVVYDDSKEIIDAILQDAIDIFQSIGMNSHI